MTVRNKKLEKLYKSFGVKIINSGSRNHIQEYGCRINGYADAKQKEVYLNYDSTYETAIHELAHILFNHKDVYWGSILYYKQEIEAELVALKVCSDLKLKFNSKWLNRYKNNKRVRHLFKEVRHRTINKIAKQITEELQKVRSK